MAYPWAKRRSGTEWCRIPRAEGYRITVRSDRFGVAGRLPRAGVGRDESTSVTTSRPTRNSRVGDLRTVEVAVGDVATDEAESGPGWRVDDVATAGANTGGPPDTLGTGGDEPWPLSRPSDGAKATVARATTPTTVHQCGLDRPWRRRACTALVERSAGCGSGRSEDGDVQASAATGAIGTRCSTSRANWLFSVISASACS